MEVSEAFNQRLRAFSVKVAPEKQLLHKAFEKGDWEMVVEVAMQLEALWSSSGIVNLRYTRYKAEAHIGLGHAEEALRLYRDELPQARPDMDLTLALALALNDELDDETASSIANKPREYYSELPSRQTRVLSHDQRVATVRAVRALDAYFEARNDAVLREAKEAIRLDRTQAVAAYVCAKTLTRMERHEEAIEFWRLASSLPGSYGEQARELASARATFGPQPSSPGFTPR